MLPTLVMFLTFCCSEGVVAQVLTLAGTPWNLTISAADVTDAGLDIPSEYSSAANQSEFNFYYAGVNKNYTWSVEVSKSDVNWPAGVQLALRRTGPGSEYLHSGSIDNGLSYITLTSVDQAFFDGKRGRIDVPIQYRLSNLSVTIPAGTYSTVVTYTITSSL